MLKADTIFFLLCFGIHGVLKAKCRYISGSELKSLQNFLKKDNLFHDGLVNNYYSAEWPLKPPHAEKVAIKEVMFDEYGTGFDLEDFLHEVDMMKHLEERLRENPGLFKSFLGLISGHSLLTKKPTTPTHSPALVLKDCLIDKKNKRGYIVMEPLLGIPSTSCTSRNNPTKTVCPVVDWANRETPHHLRLFIDIANNLQNLAKAGFMHEDIKPESIGVADIANMTIKLIDFGPTQKKR